MLRMVKRIDQTVTDGNYNAVIAFECGHVMDHPDPNHKYNPGQKAECVMCGPSPEPKKKVKTKKTGVWRDE